MSFDAQTIARRRALPVNVTYPPQLPISAHVDEIKQLVAAHQVVVVAGETGSGKTTQLPKICLDLGLGRAGMIGHTQPRRLAARTVATRVADELGVELGQSVGYAVRFSERVSQNTLVKLVTDGLLLSEIRHDRSLSRYQVIIVDEAHERSLNVDFLLGFLRRLLKRRDDLKLIITSATIDVDAFAKHFDDAPVVEIGGRGYPVEMRYVDGEDDSEQDAVVACIREIDGMPVQAAARDVLIFQSGEREIMETAQVLRRTFAERFEILPLYARLSARDQARVFRAGKKRRIVIATNVAETSLTVPNIGFVIDPGFARISRYSYRSKLQRLPVEPISQASANQRAGRCGRVAPGVCFRLYAEDDFASRPEFTDPEIKRTNLAQVVLQMHSLGLGEVSRFGFLDPPDPRAVRDAQRLLLELGALQEGKLTGIGRDMARLPVDPRLARMLLAASRERCLTEMLVVVSALAIADPRERPLEKRGSADRAHSQFLDPRSDFLGVIKLWHWYLQQREALGSARLRKTLAATYLSPSRMREWHSLHRQLRLAARELGLRPNDKPAGYASVHRALLSGSLSFIGRHDEKGSYQGPRNLRFRIFPGSALAKSQPRWLVAGEISETQRVYARSVARVEAKWIEDAAPHLVKRQYSEPHWSVRRGEVMAFESVTLFGLPLAERRRVSYRRVDAPACRELFLLEGLVRGGIDQPPEFLAHNQAIVADIAEEEAKGRRRDVLIAESAQADLYDAVVPPEICTSRTLKRWWNKRAPQVGGELFFSREQLVSSDYDRLSEDDFPGVLELRGLTLKLSYRFAPGEPDDGVCVDIPLGVLPGVVGEALEWSVSGFFAALLEQWLRTLPKQKRRPLAPITDRVEEVVAILVKPDRYRQGRLLPALARVLNDLYRVEVGAADWDRSRVDAHLLVNVRVIGEGGKVLGQGRDVDVLKAQFAAAVQEQMSPRVEAIEADGLDEFPDSELPATLRLSDSEGDLVAYPALVDHGRSVSVRLFADRSEQRTANRSGYARLALLGVPQTVRVLKKELEKHGALGLRYATLGSAAALTDEILRAAAWRCFFASSALPATRAEFDETIKSRRGDLASAFEEVVALLEEILQKRFDLMTKLDTLTSPAFADAVQDVRAHVAQLVPSDVLSVTLPSRLAALPHYLDAMDYRLSHLQGKVARDTENLQLMASLGERLEHVRGSEGVEAEEVDALRFALEDLRVALFAQPMSRERTSVKRVNAAMAAVERDLGLV